MTLEILTITNGAWKQKCYLLFEKETREALIIDPGSDEQQISYMIDINSLVPICIINTHGHYDHIGAVFDLQEKYRIPFFIHEKEKRLIARANMYAGIFDSTKRITIPNNIEYLSVGKKSISLGGFDVKIIEASGHTKGSICILIENYCFVGDTLFKGKVGRTDLPGGNELDLQHSLKKMMELPKSIEVFPGHGKKTTIGEEIENNLELAKILRGEVL